MRVCLSIFPSLPPFPLPPSSYLSVIDLSVNVRASDFSSRTIDCWRFAGFSVLRFPLPRTPYSRPAYFDLALPLTSPLAASASKEKTNTISLPPPHPQYSPLSLFSPRSSLSSPSPLSPFPPSPCFPRGIDSWWLEGPHSFLIIV